MITKKQLYFIENYSRNYAKEKKIYNQINLKLKEISNNRIELTQENIKDFPQHFMGVISNEHN